MPVMSLMLREVIDAKDAIYDSDFNATVLMMAQMKHISLIPVISFLPVMPLKLLFDKLQ